VVVVSHVGTAGVVQVGLIVGRAVGPAATRNRVKRRLRAAVRETPLQTGHDYVVIAGREVENAGFEALKEWLIGAVETERKSGG